MSPPQIGTGDLAVTLSGPIIVPYSASFDITATLTNDGPNVIEYAEVTLQLPVGLSLTGNANVYLPDIPAFGQQQATWQVTTGTQAGSYIILATAEGMYPGTTYQLIAETTIIVEVVDPAAFDDGDGISSDIDTDPGNYSNAFSDVSLGGTTYGVITSRGDQVLSIGDHPNPVGVRIVAGTASGPTQAEISLCGGVSTIYVTEGDDVVATCGSAIIYVEQGTVEVSFFGPNGELATAALNGGNGLTFKPESVSIIAPRDNFEPVTVVIEVNGVLREFALVPGATAGLIRGLAARLINVRINSDRINPRSNRPVPVVILGDGGFSVFDVNVLTLTLGSNDARPISGARFEDTDSDGLIDLVVNFHSRDAGINLAALSLCLSGETHGGVPIGGCGAVSIVIASGQTTAASVFTPAQSNEGESDGTTATDSTAGDDGTATTDGIAEAGDTSTTDGLTDDEGDDSATGNAEDGASANGQGQNAGADNGQGQGQGNGKGLGIGNNAEATAGAEGDDTTATEGVTESDGSTDSDGTVDGDGSTDSNGTVDGDGSADSDGTVDGDGSADSEGTVDGDGSADSDGTVDGNEGSSTDGSAESDEGTSTDGSANGQGSNVGQDNGQGASNSQGQGQGKGQDNNNGAGSASTSEEATEGESDGSAASSEGDGSTTGSEGDGSATGSEGDGSAIGNEDEDSATGSEGDGSPTNGDGDGDGSTTSSEGDGSTATSGEGSTTNGEGDGSTADGTTESGSGNGNSGANGNGPDSGGTGPGGNKGKKQS